MGGRSDSRAEPFFQKCLAKSGGVTLTERRAWRDGIYEEIGDWAQSQGELGIQRMCELAGVSRASFYRRWEEKAPEEAAVALRDAVHRIALAHRSYGYRRITRLVHAAGFAVGQEKVRGIMRTDNLLAVRRRKFVTTTDGNHRFLVYSNLAESLELSGIDPLWVADITGPARKFSGQ